METWCFGQWRVNFSPMINTTRRRSHLDFVAPEVLGRTSIHGVIHGALNIKQDGRNSFCFLQGFRRSRVTSMQINYLGDDSLLCVYFCHQWSNMDFHGNVNNERSPLVHSGSSRSIHSHYSRSLSQEEAILGLNRSRELSEKYRLYRRRWYMLLVLFVLNVSNALVSRRLAVARIS